jgi:hypothetical protein
VNKHILAVLTADEAKPLGIVKPLHCSLFHVDSFLSTDKFSLPQDPNRGPTTNNRRKNQSVSNDVARVAHFATNISRIVRENL